MKKLTEFYDLQTETNFINCLNSHDAFIFDEDNPFEHEPVLSKVKVEDIEFVDWEDNPFK